MVVIQASADWRPKNAAAQLAPKCISLTCFVEANMLHGMSLEIEKLSSTLFWDVEQSTVNWPQHRSWLLQRILERGRWEDWLLIATQVSIEELEAAATEVRLAPREQNFLHNWLRNHANSH